MTDVVESFWKKWVDADELQQGDLTEKLIRHSDIVKIAMIYDAPEDMKYKIISRLFNSYLSDLYNFLWKEKADLQRNVVLLNNTVLQKVKQIDELEQEKRNSLHPAQLRTSVKKHG